MEEKNRKQSQAKQQKLDKIKAAEAKKRKKKLIIVSCIAAAVLLFFAAALIYSLLHKEEKKNGGIVLGGSERDYENSVVLGEYKGIEYVPAEVNVSEEDLEKYISEQLEKEPNYETDYSRDHTEVKKGDKVLLQYSFVSDNITYIEEETAIYECGSNDFGKNFDKALEGTAVGGSAEAEAVMPEDFEKTKAAGKTGTVQFYVTGVVIVYGYLTDAYCDRISDGKYRTVDEYKAYCMDTLVQTEENKAEEAKWNSIWQTLVDSCELTIDEKSVEKEYQDMIEYYTSYASYLNTTMEELVTKAYGYTAVQDFYDYCREYARTIVEERVIYQAIIKKEGITVDDKTYNEKISQYMEESGYENQADFETMVGKDKIIEMMENDMVSELLISSAVAVEQR